MSSKVGLFRWLSSSNNALKRERGSDVLRKRKIERKAKKELVAHEDDVRIDKLMDQARFSDAAREPEFIAELLLCCASESTKTRYKAVKMLQVLPPDAFEEKEDGKRMPGLFPEEETVAALENFSRISQEKGYAGSGRLIGLVKYHRGLDEEDVVKGQEASFVANELFYKPTQAVAHFGVSQEVLGQCRAKGVSVELPFDTQKHVRALRLPVGSHIVLFDGSGVFAEAELLPQRGAAVVHKVRFACPPAHRFVGVCAVPASSDLGDVMVGKLAELGCDEFVCLHAERAANAVAKEETRRVRWQRLALAAAEVSKRLHCMHISPASLSVSQLCFDSHMRGFWGTLRAANYASEEIPVVSRPVVATYDGKAFVQQEIAVVIGPEGGFTSAEEEMLAKQFAPICFSDANLRTETAAISGMAILRNQFVV